MRYLPTVTECIAPWLDFSKIRPDVLQAAADRGTEAHRVCLDLYAKGLPVIGIGAEVEGYFQSFRLWFDSTVDEVILCEERLFDEATGYCGQIDLLAHTKQNETVMVDLKTPLSLSRSWSVQLASYLNLLKKNNYTANRIGSLRLNRDGKTPRMDFYEGSADRDFSIFLSALNCFRYFKQ